MFDDYIFADDGNDTVDGDRGNDTIDGWNGNDIINGGRDNDVLLGWFGNDTMNGGSGDDTLRGEQNNDLLIGSTGNDSMDGGRGTDTADYSDLGSAITLESQGVVNKGAAGTDQLEDIEIIIGAIGQANTIDGSTGNGPTSFDVDLSADSLTVNGIPGLGSVNFTVENFVNVTGTDNGDDIQGDSQNNDLKGDGGNDVLLGWFGNDTMNGGSGDDTLRGGQDNDLLIGSRGNDSMDGGSGTDTADYGSLGSAITLESQGVVNKGAAGTDQLEDIEVIIGAIGQANTIDGSTGNGPTSFDVDLSANSLTVNGVPGLGNVNFTVENFVNVTGTDNGDDIQGNSQNNDLKGDGGDDYIFADDGNDTVEGGSGDDNLDGWNGNDIMNGDSGDDVLLGWFGNDIINGGLGDDTLRGEQDNDVLIGSTGNDSMDGGRGTDTADYSSLGSAITLESQGVVNKGSAGTDQLEDIEVIIGAIRQANTIDGSTGSGPTSFDVDLSANSLTVNGVPGLGSVNFTVENFVNVTGTDSSDRLTGNAQDNVLEGGLGNDTLTGGLGADFFVFNSLSEGIDLIEDFEWREGDKIQVSGAGFGATNTNQFNFDFGTGALSFLGTQFAQLNNLQFFFNFIPALDLEIV
ncbi:MAG: hypothetical protein AB4058_18230 [Microcystaceae cyanobacterium]